MDDLLKKYAAVVGEDVIAHIEKLAAPLKGAKVVHVNSTREGGGVVEILEKMVPLMRAYGVDASWEVIQGNEVFFSCTKGFHNGLQGKQVNTTDVEKRAYKEVNEQNAEELRGKLEEADFVVIHDPQPAPLLKMCPNRKGKWIWRCHIDLSRPYRPVWNYLRDWIAPYDASIFSIPQFSQSLPHEQFIIPPSIDPLGDKNRDLTQEEIAATIKKFSLNPELPMVVQVSRFDRFKDPIGVIEAYKIAKKYTPFQLVLAGGGATDDPEGPKFLEEVSAAAGEDPNIHILFLPAGAHLTINALQRAADIVVQKSLKEGFALTVTEALWKNKPVIAGDVGGIRLQVIDHLTGFRVSSPEGAALRMRYLLSHPDKAEQLGKQAKEFVRDNFLITRHLKDYLTMLHSVQNPGLDRMEIKENA